MKPGIIVHKFGGTSLANAEKYKSVAKIVTERNSYAVVVVSAMSKVTDSLIELVELAAAQNESYLENWSALKNRHLDTVRELLPPSSQESIIQILNLDFENIKEILRGVWLLRSFSSQIIELVSGYGEVWSAQLLNNYLISQKVDSNWLDARRVLVVEPTDSAVSVIWPSSQEKTDLWFKDQSKKITVVTGFVASTTEGIATTLKRNGSDFSASIFGALLNAQEIIIWTDVDGVLSADPRLVPEAVVLAELSYHEAAELAYFGAKVVHPSTMAPAIDKKIPIWIKNTFSPEKLGTKIHSKSQSTHPVKGFSTIIDIALVSVEGTGMVGVPGFAYRLFGTLKEIGVSVIMISQASSEHSICFAIPLSQSAKVRQALANAFFAEIHKGIIEKIEISENCSILAAVGDGMVHKRGVAGIFFTSLAKAGVSIRAIAQGSSERNISVVVKREDATRALRAAHAGFFLSAHAISIGIIGVGGVGSTLISQLKEASEFFKNSSLDIRVRGLANSKRMLLHPDRISLETWEKDLQEKGELLDMVRFVNHLRADHIPHSALIDCTSDQDLANQYITWMTAGFHIITPNKKAGSGPMADFRKLKIASTELQKHFLCETTVGAGLPVINVLRDLVQTGDKIIAIEGILSGTLSFLFNAVSSGRSFSEALIEAKDKGYTEPDPRDDLSGVDFARKLVILARESGWPLELADIHLESLVPESMAKLGISEFMSKVSELDTLLEKPLQEAKLKCEVLKYVGHIDSEGKATVSLRSYPSLHPFAQISATDNIVAFKTKRYFSQPLYVRGPGAGREVTAAGIFADLLRLCSYLGATL